MPFTAAAGTQRVGVLIVAAGRSRRMEGVDKIFAPVLGRPLLAWTVAAFEGSPLVDEIVVAVDRRRIGDARALAREEGWRKVSQVCRGGEGRQDSVREALWRLSPCEWVAVHDGARPCVAHELLHQGLLAAQETGAAVPGLAVTDTLKRVDADGFIEATVDRSGLWAVQTPQVFRYAILWAAYQQAVPDVTDDAAVVAQLGHRVRVYPGAPENIKVTALQDLATVALYIQRQQATVTAS
ncbi:MAG: 2-C-methyl-D-erythritol 4-phosphate cytidylyltransferase [Chloroflexi bacterium]|nr:2-C-methyl-D-erythritol 4-phosphate cytidylyltransferase [Chloroflexota bacterium]